MKWRFLGRQRSVAALLPTLLLFFIIAFGGYYIFKSIDYGGEFEKRRAESRAYLRATVDAQMENLSREILTESAKILAADSSSAGIQQLRNHLDALKETLEQIAITDRSTSLDNVFERYSTLVGIVTLLFGGLGIFTGLQFYEQSRQTREEFDSVSAEIDTKAARTIEEMAVQVRQTKEELIRTAEKGTEMIWVVASALEKLINFQIIDEKESTSILNALYLSGFRFQLYSRKESERMSALQNLWAQGDCTDLRVLWSICNSETEPAQMRNLARRALEKILKTCSHHEGHPELGIS